MARSVPLVIPVFVSHLGCPHRCIFCDQTLFAQPVPPEDIPRAVHDFLAHCRPAPGRRRLIAFFGGTFTGIAPQLFQQYLAQARMLIDQGVVHGIKASTRPDMVDETILDQLKSAGCVELELGVQSLDNAVLAASRRGYAASDVQHACARIRRAELQLGIQLMPGLPGEDRPSFAATVEKTAGLHPDTLRIYPTLVIQGTELERRYRSGHYLPLSLDEAVARAFHAYARLRLQGARILRMGLPPADRSRIVAGPVHDAFGELVKAYGFARMAKKILERQADAVIRVNPHDVSCLLGHQKANQASLGFSFQVDGSVPESSLHAGCAGESACVSLGDVIHAFL